MDKIVPFEDKSYIQKVSAGDRVMDDNHARYGIADLLASLFEVCMVP